MPSVPLLRSAVLPAPFVHGFTTRQGGVSQGGFASLNLGAKWGDTQTNVDENRRRVLQAAGLAQVYTVRQVHGAAVVELEGHTPAPVNDREADAIIAYEPQVGVGVYTADCVALLVCDVRTGAVAAAHAGWRGTVAGVATAVVHALERRGSAARDLRAVIGPSIGPCCFEVGPEVAAAFAPEFVRRGKAKPTIDLRAANCGQLMAAGVPAASIDARPPCTMCDGSRFYSFRRDGQNTGQHLAFITRAS
jgi:YfiH family protein